MTTFSDWFPYRRRGGDVELFAFPPAGAASSGFNGLRGLLAPGNIDVAPAVLPGHGRRLRERLHRRMEPLIADLMTAASNDQYSAFMGDYALIGHCSGALVAYEFAAALVRAPCANPSLLIVCSCLPPPMIFDTGVGRLPVKALVAHTASMGGTPSVLLDDPDFMAMLERPLRADWEMFDAYAQPLSTPRLPVPILAVRGRDDPNCEARYLQQWRDQTAAAFRSAELAAGHWTLDGEGSVTLACEIRAAVAALD